MPDEPAASDAGSDGTTSASTQAAGYEEARSPLVGFMSMPVSRRLPMRRSTLVMLVAFVGFGILLWQYPPQGDSTGGQIIRAPDGSSIFCPDCTKVAPPATTTTTPGSKGGSTTTTAPTTRGEPSTTTTTSSG